MGLYVPIEELRTAVNTDELTSSARDNDLKVFCLSAQAFAEDYCKRSFDGLKLKTEFYNGDEVIDRLILRNYPLISISKLYDDVGYDYTATSEVSSSDYVLIAERGELFLRNSKFRSARRNVKIVYKGGYVPEVTVVTAALAADNMTILNSLSAYAQPFSLFVQTATAQTAGSVTITGTDIDGVAQSEVVTFTGTSAQRKVSIYEWGSITDVDALAVRGAGSTGTITVKATSIPNDLRVALALYVSHLYFQKFEQNINVTSRNEETESEGGITKDVPAEVKSLLNNYRNYL